jgi:PleD family two-component response regulator
MILLLSEDIRITEEISNLLKPLGHELLKLSGRFSIPENYVNNLLLAIICVSSIDSDALYGIEKIKSRQATSRIPILAVSAAGSPLFFIDSFERGASDYINYPFKGEIFIQKVQKLIEKK